MTTAWLRSIFNSLTLVLGVLNWNVRGGAVFVVVLGYDGRSVESHSGTQEAMKHADMTGPYFLVVADSRISQCVCAVADFSNNSVLHPIA